MFKKSYTEMKICDKISHYDINCWEMQHHAGASKTQTDCCDCCCGGPDFLIIIVCTGCMSRNTGELLSLPQLPDEYIELQNALNDVLKAGAVFSAPTSGSYRQSVQLYDINGDGTDEALAFFNTSGEKPLKIYIYNKNQNSYTRAAVIEGDGTDIESIGYVDMDGDGWMEIVAGNELQPWDQRIHLKALWLRQLQQQIILSILRRIWMKTGKRSFM